MHEFDRKTRSGDGVDERYSTGVQLIRGNQHVSQNPKNR